MIICKECGNKFKLKLYKSKVTCDYCNVIIDFSKIKRVTRVRHLVRVIDVVARTVLLFIAVSLPRWFPWPQILLIGSLFVVIVWALEMLVFRPTARRVIAKMYNNYDVEL